MVLSLLPAGGGNVTSQWKEPCLLRAPLPREVLPAVLGKQGWEEQDEALNSLWKETPGKQVLSANGERPLDFNIYLPPPLQWMAEFNT